MSISKLGFASFWGVTQQLPRPAGVSSVVFVPNNLETHKPHAEMNRICMAFMDRFRPRFESTKRGSPVRGNFEDGDWMFWFSPFNQKYKKTHLTYLEHIMSDECTPLKNLCRPDSWAVVKGEKHSGFVFVHNDLNFVSKYFFSVNCFIRALWETPEVVDRWLLLVENGVDKNEALYFMWINPYYTNSKYQYSFLSSQHGPLADLINLDNFLAGTPEIETDIRFAKGGWETGIHKMWGAKHRYQDILGLNNEGRFLVTSEKDIVTLILERHK